MTDPERLLDADGTGLSATLLRAGRDDAPSAQLLEDTLVVLGVGAAVVGTGAAASALGAGSGATLLKAGGSTSLATLAVKWLGIGAVGGALSMGAAAVIERSMSPPSKPHVAALAPAPVETPTVAAARPAALAEASPEPAADVRPAELARTSAAAQPKKPTEPSIAEETASIDQARRELAAGNAGQALATLDLYDRRPGLHRLQQEALLLRMDALSRSGNTAAARTIATSLLAQSPNGPHAARARQVLGEPSQKK